GQREVHNPNSEALEKELRPCLPSPCTCCSSLRPPGASVGAPFLPSGGVIASWDTAAWPVSPASRLLGRKNVQRDLCK
ncbi:hypothetical protein GDO81_029483, partial [Engystomops pustulosus]